MRKEGGGGVGGGVKVEREVGKRNAVQMYCSC